MLVVNTRGRHDNHSHFNTQGKNREKVWDTCQTLIRLMENKRIPKSNYLLDSAIRLVTDRKYKARLLQEKERRVAGEYRTRN